LPKGTLLRLTGEIEGRFYPVEVELEQGNIEGWVRQDFLNLEEQRREQEQRERRKREGVAAVENAPRNTIPRKRNRLRVPKDESLLLGRKPTFFFGVHGGGAWSITNAISGSSFTGLGFSLGGHVGTLLVKDVPVRFEVGYTSVGGQDAAANEGTWGFIDAGLTGGYQVDDFEFFARVHYGYAVSVSNLPGGLNNAFVSVSDLSSLWIGGGIAYRVMASELTNLSVRGMYNLSFLQSPFGFQTFHLQLVFDLHV
jgi:hypothetical protein